MVVFSSRSPKRQKKHELLPTTSIKMMSVLFRASDTIKLRLMSFTIRKLRAKRKLNMVLVKKPMTLNRIWSTFSS